MNLSKPKHVAKIILIDQNGNHLLMQRSDHPTFGYDPDLPGGTMEDGEDSLQTLLREVAEEIGLELRADQVAHHFTGAGYSRQGTVYHLYTANLQQRPDIIMSWEHSSYGWMSRTEFLHQLEDAVDTYMHMVRDVVAKSK